MSHLGMITSPSSNDMISGYKPRQTDNQRARNTLSNSQNLGYRVKYSHEYVIIRDYYSINPSLHYQPKSLCLRVDNGRGLILKAMAKTPCYNLFITYSYSLV